MATKTPAKLDDTSALIVRRATLKDTAIAGQFGAALARAHFAWDPARFFIWDDIEVGYAQWLNKERRNKNAVVLVAQRGGDVVGYAYGRMEPRDYNALREACGVAIDLFVAPTARTRGVGRALAQALIGALAQKGAPFVVLQVAAHNKRAQRFFKDLGCRPTMIEMAIHCAHNTRRAGARRANVVRKATRAR